MMMTTNTDQDLRDRLQAARAAAFEVHGALLETTRREYEREFGRVADAATLLKVVTSEPAFAWHPGFARRGRHPREGYPHAAKRCGAMAVVLPKG